MQLIIEITDEFSFYETVHAHGWRDLAPYRWHSERATLERIERLNDGAVIRLLITQPEQDVLLLETDADADAAEITARVRRMLQLDRDMKEFYTYCHARAELAHIPLKKQGRLLRAPTLWEDAVKVILTTNTTWRQTRSMTERFVKEWGAAHTANPEFRAFPTPERISALNFEHFANLAKVGYRAAAIYELAGRIASGQDVEMWNHAEMPTDTLRENLLALRGIGPYSAACLMLYLGKPDRVNSDSWARTLVGRELGRPVSDAEVHAFFAKYDEWRGLVYHFYPWSEQETNSSSVE